MVRQLWSLLLPRIYLANRNARRDVWRSSIPIWDRVSSTAEKSQSMKGTYSIWGAVCLAFFLAGDRSWAAESTHEIR